ncbi:MAG: GNAT family N-acetyltransferase [Candidatus Eremiobacteraeota bacterium]|nr:GNAT family N-acetyltransferase [Candidatus Eremiobacteraeota bacterium]
MRSKAAWGYDAEFMERVRPDMQVTEDDLRESETVIAECDGIMAGFTRIVTKERDAFMHDLFIEPKFFRTGIGRVLFDAAVDIARAGGANRLALHADPNAEVFYQRMGMRTISHVKSAAGPNRFLPVMVLDLE